MDGVFKALADPTRRSILRLLNERDMTAGEIAAHFGVPAPNLDALLGMTRVFARVRGLYPAA